MYGNPLLFLFSLNGSIFTSDLGIFVHRSYISQVVRLDQYTYKAIKLRKIHFLDLGGFFFAFILYIAWTILIHTRLLLTFSYFLVFFVLFFVFFFLAAKHACFYMEFRNCFNCSEESLLGYIL